jgi:pilus assembly protein CpaC
VQLDVVVATARPGVVRDFAARRLKRPFPAIVCKQDQPQPFVCVLDRPQTRKLVSFLQALEKEKRGRVQAAPRLVTVSGNPASYLDGIEQMVPMPAGLGEVGVQFEGFGTRLNFLPVVLDNGLIHLEVEAEVSAADSEANRAVAGPRLPPQRIRSTVELASGQTLVIGGLLQEEQELVVLVTPFRVVEEVDEGGEIRFLRR